MRLLLEPLVRGEVSRLAAEVGDLGQYPRSAYRRGVLWIVLLVLIALIAIAVVLSLGVRRSTGSARRHH
jgi:hypothetical protein